MSAADSTLLHLALDDYDAGRLVQAVPALRSLAAKYPHDFQANEALGSLYAETGDLVRATTYLTVAEKLSPREPLVHANLGAVYLKLGKVSEAVEELRAAATFDPGNAATQSSLGQALMLAGDPKAASESFDAAATIHTADWELRYNQAVALFDAGDTAGAARVLTLIPAAAMTDQFDSLAGDAAERNGDFKLALTHFQAAAQKNPSDANIFAVVAELLRHWTWEEAVRVANFGSERYPASTHFKLAAGIGYYANNQYPQAVATFSTLLAEEPNNQVVADLLGRSCTLLPDGQEAGCSAMYDYAERHPGNAITDTYAAIAILHGARPDLGRAETLLKSAIAAQPEYAEAYLQMGILQQTRQQWAESAVSLEHSIKLRPAAAEAHYRLSRAYAHLGRRDEAQAQVALHQTYAQQAKDSLNARMQEVMKFVLESK